jgi:hypothetical protein
MPLMTVSMSVMTVLQSAEVAHIPHESRLSLIARHPLIQRNTFTHFRGVRLDITTRFFNVLIDHQGPPITSFGPQESPLLYPLIPIQMDPLGVHCTRYTDWYAKLASTTYYARLYLCRLMVILFLWVVAPRTGP